MFTAISFTILIFSHRQACGRFVTLSAIAGWEKRLTNKSVADQARSKLQQMVRAARSLGLGGRLIFFFFEGLCGI